MKDWVIMSLWGLGIVLFFGVLWFLDRKPKKDGGVVEKMETKKEDIIDDGFVVDDYGIKEVPDLSDEEINKINEVPTTNNEKLYELTKTEGSGMVLLRRAYKYGKVDRLLITKIGDRLLITKIEWEKPKQEEQ